MEKLFYVKQTEGKGYGIFAAREIRKDELISEFRGPRVTIEAIGLVPPEVQDHLFNVGLNEYLVTFEPEVRTNHSCDPNAGIRKDVFLVAMRDIGKDEEITFDYSTITADDWEMACQCVSPSCRKIIGDYRKLPVEVKQKYASFTPDWIKEI